MAAPLLNLSGKDVFVAGATSGIDLGPALGFAAAGSTKS